MADKLLFWTGYSSVFGKTADTQNPRYEAPSDATFAEMKSRGIDAIVCQTGYFGPEDTIGQRAVDVNGAKRAAVKGVESYLGLYWAPYYDAPIGHRYPFGANWDDDAAWAAARSALTSYGARAKQYGFKGLALDFEDYPGAPGAIPLEWGIGTPRAKIRQRGAEAMAAMVAGFGPGLELYNYFSNFPGSLEEVERANINYWNGANVDFFIGANTNPDFARWEFFDSWFYKGLGWTEADWRAKTLDAAARFRTFWQNGGSGGTAPLAFAGLTAAQLLRIAWDAFIWLDGDLSTGRVSDAPMSVANANIALPAARDGNSGRMIPVYANQGLTNTAGQLDQTFDYRPYIPAMQAASGGSAPPPPPPPPPSEGTMQTVLVDSTGRTFPPPFTKPHAADVDVGNVCTYEGVWKIPSVFTGTQVLAGKGSPAGITPAVENQNGQIVFVFYGYNIGPTVKSQPVQVGVDLVVHFISGGGVKQIFVNGVDVSVAANATVAFQKTTAPLTVGCDNPSGANFVGTGKSVTLYDKTMSADEVRTRYAALSPDITPPDTTLTKTGESSEATFTFTATEAGSTFEARLDGGSWSTVTSPYKVSGLAAGPHTLEVRGKDPAGNVDATPAFVSWTAGADATKDQQIADLQAALQGMTVQRDQALSNLNAVTVQRDTALAKIAHALADLA